MNFGFSGLNVFVNINDARLYCKPRTFRGRNENEFVFWIGNRLDEVTEVRLGLRIGRREDQIGPISRTRFRRSEVAVVGSRSSGRNRSGFGKREHCAALDIGSGPVISETFKNEFKKTFILPFCLIQNFTWLYIIINQKALISTKRRCSHYPQAIFLNAFYLVVFPCSIFLQYICKIKIETFWLLFLLTKHSSTLELLRKDDFGKRVLLFRIFRDSYRSRVATTMPQPLIVKKNVFSFE